MIDSQFLDNHGFGSVEEMIGAYIEGNLSSEELSVVTNAINNNRELSELVNETSSDMITLREEPTIEIPLDLTAFELPDISMFQDDSISPSAFSLENSSLQVDADNQITGFGQNENASQSEPYNDDNIGYSDGDSFQSDAAGDSIDIPTIDL